MCLCLYVWSQSSRVGDDHQSNPDTARSRGVADSSATVSSDDEAPQNHVAHRHVDFSGEEGPISGRMIEASDGSMIHVSDLSPEPPPTVAALSEWSPLAVNFSLEVVRAKGLPQAENAGIFPYTYACVSLLYADL